MPNAKNLRSIAAIIRDHEDQFHLNDWGRRKAVPDKDGLRVKSPLVDCNTVCCIAGWTNAKLGTLKENGEIDFSNTTVASQFLGLSYDFSEDLFIPVEYPETQNIDYANYRSPWSQAARLGIIPEDEDVYKCSAEQAAQVLEAIADGRIETY